MIKRSVLLTTVLLMSPVTHAYNCDKMEEFATKIMQHRQAETPVSVVAPACKTTSITKAICAVAWQEPVKETLTEKVETVQTFGNAWFEMCIKMKQKNI